MQQREARQTKVTYWFVQKGKTKVDKGNLHPTAIVKTRVPWIPPGKTSTRDASYKWEVTFFKENIDCFCFSVVRKHPVIDVVLLIIQICTKGPMHRLEITPPVPEHSHSVLRLADLTSEEEEGLHGRISQYERKVDSLLSEVSCLKNEVSYTRKSSSYVVNGVLVTVKRTVNVLWPTVRINYLFEVVASLLNMHFKLVKFPLVVDWKSVQC